jgi:tetratricopeptide (TPR) repeat protein
MGGRAPIAIGWAREAVALGEASGDPGAILSAKAGLGIASVFTGGGSNLEELFREGIRLSEDSGDWWMLGMAAGFAGAGIAGVDPEAAQELAEQGEAAARRTGNPFMLGAVSMAHGRVYGRIGRIDDAAASFGVAVARFSEIGDERLSLAARSDLGHALRRGGRLNEAMAAYRTTIGGWVRFGHRGAVANQLENVAYVAIEQGDAERAARLLGAAETLRAAADQPMAFDEAPEYEVYVGRLRKMLEPAAFENAWEAGRQSSMADAVALATGD